MVGKADAQYEVTVGKLKRSSRCKASKRTILRKLHARGIYFRPLRQKPTLTEDDVSARKKFADVYALKYWPALAMGRCSFGSSSTAHGAGRQPQRHTVGLLRKLCTQVAL